MPLRSDSEVTQGNFNWYYDIILCSLRDKARYFHSPFAFTAAVNKSIAIPFGMEKLEWRGYL